MRSDRPLTLTVEQAGQLLGVGRSTAYELGRTGELESLRLRRRLVVPTAQVAARLDLTLADVWSALEAPSPAAVGLGRSRVPGRGKVAGSEPEPASLF